MKILGIETSCDETAAAIVRDGTKLISNIVASSQSMHAKYGGIIPEQAAREQIKAMIPVIHEALVTDIDAIAVTVGPGLIGSLLVGVETAKALAYAWNRPIIPVNHLIGHIYGNWIDTPPPKFPALVLLVSGGHSELILMTDHGKFKYLGGTRDDAAGECFDKCARLLNLGYPGGPMVEKNAVSKNLTPLPRPMIKEKSFDFSFSGLKTAVLNRKNEDPQGLAYELQEAITDVLVT
ncbi:MAG: tRNA (adenosine(37)-N6)-threonylcarbamoyltransferase complex transferase subunit TsaD, partial [Patescibacteria group bacterium]